MCHCPKSRQREAGPTQRGRGGVALGGVCGPWHRHQELPNSSSKTHTGLKRRQVSPNSPPEVRACPGTGVTGSLNSQSRKSPGKASWHLNKPSVREGRLEGPGGMGGGTKTLSHSSRGCDCHSSGECWVCARQALKGLRTQGGILGRWHICGALTPVSTLRQGALGAWGKTPSDRIAREPQNALLGLAIRLGPRDR